MNQPRSKRIIWFFRGKSYLVHTWGYALSSTVATPVLLTSLCLLANYNHTWRYLGPCRLIPIFSAAYIPKDLPTSTRFACSDPAETAVCSSRFRFTSLLSKYCVIDKSGPGEVVGFKWLETAFLDCGYVTGGSLAKSPVIVPDTSKPAEDRPRTPHRYLSPRPKPPILSVESFKSAHLPLR